MGPDHIMMALRSTVRELLVQRGRRRGALGRSGRVAVLCYHSIHPTKAFASATPELFAQQLRWLTAECEIISFRQVLDVARAGKRARPAVAITFDDGYADNFEWAFPLLCSYGAQATFFVTAGLLEHDPGVVGRFQQLRRVPREDVRPMTWPQLREMRRAGMEVGTHTYSHPSLARLDRTAAAHELRRPKDLVEERLGERVDLMAYPFGKPRRHFTRETMALVGASGYTYAAAVAFRTVRPSDSPLALPRFFVPRDSVPTLREKVLGAWDLVGVWQERLPATLQELSWKTP